MPEVDPHLDRSVEETAETVHHGGARERRSKRRAGKMELQLTSMIDVIFQLLIYFVVTANFMIDEGVLTADLPQGSGAGDPLDPPEAPLYIELQSAPSGNDVIIQVGQSQMTSFSQLTAHLNTLIVDPERGLQGAYLPDNPVIIRPQAQVRWQHVVNAFNSGINARFENINFAAGSGGQ